MSETARILKYVVIALVTSLSPALVHGQMPDLSQLDSDTRSSIELACIGTKGDGPAPYRACVEKQLAGSAGSGPPPDLSQLDSDTRSSIQLACIGSKADGPAPYRDCVAQQLASIGLQVSTVSAVESPSSAGPNPEKSATAGILKKKHGTQRLTSTTSTDHRLERRKHTPEFNHSTESRVPMSIVLILLAIALFYMGPFLWVLLSGRSHGGAKFGWLIVVICFSWLGLAAFLILTQSPKEDSD